MKEMLTGFAAHRQAAGPVRSGLQPALHRLANRDVFLLDLLAHRDAVPEI